MLGELYGALRLFTNLFQPSFKLKSSERDGGRIKRQHHPPRMPLQRLINSGALTLEQAQGRLKVCPRRYWRGGQHGVRSAEMAALHVRNQFRLN